MKNVLFVCIGNAGRSQMSEALFSRAAQGRHEARSAGTQPAASVHPVVVEAMAELGIDLSARVPHRLERSDAEWADIVVTMGCGDACPVVLGKRYIDWQLEDPKDKKIERVREIRDEIAVRVEQLLADLAAEGRK